MGFTRSSSAERSGSQSGGWLSKAREWVSKPSENRNRAQPAPLEKRHPGPEQKSSEQGVFHEGQQVFIKRNDPSRSNEGEIKQQIMMTDENHQVVVGYEVYVDGRQSLKEITEKDLQEQNK